MAGNFCSSVGNCRFVMKYSWYLACDGPKNRANHDNIRHKVFMKVSCHESFVLYGTWPQFQPIVVAFVFHVLCVFQDKSNL